MKESKNSEEFDICQAFAESAEYRVPVGAVARLEELLGTGSMIKWGKIVSGISDKDLAILSVGLTNKGRHFLLAGLADERLPEVVEISKYIENDINDAEAVAQMIMRKWDKF